MKSKCTKLQNKFVSNMRNMRIDEIANNAKYRKDKQLQNLTIFRESSQFCKFVNF